MGQEHFRVAYCFKGVASSCYYRFSYNRYYFMAVVNAGPKHKPILHLKIYHLTCLTHFSPQVVLQQLPTFFEGLGSQIPYSLCGPIGTIPFAHSLLVQINDNC